MCSGAWGTPNLWRMRTSEAPVSRLHRHTQQLHRNEMWRMSPRAVSGATLAAASANATLLRLSWSKAFRISLSGHILPLSMSSFVVRTMSAHWRPLHDEWWRQRIKVGLPTRVWTKQSTKKWHAIRYLQIRVRNWFLTHRHTLKFSSSLLVHSWPPCFDFSFSACFILLFILPSSFSICFLKSSSFLFFLFFDFLHFCLGFALLFVSLGFDHHTLLLNFIKLADFIDPAEVYAWKTALLTRMRSATAMLRMKTLPTDFTVALCCAAIQFSDRHSNRSFLLLRIVDLLVDVVDVLDVSVYEIAAFPPSERLAF